MGLGVCVRVMGRYSSFFFGFFFFGFFFFLQSICCIFYDAPSRMIIYEKAKGGSKHKVKNAIIVCIKEGKNSTN